MELNKSMLIKIIGNINDAVLITETNQEKIIYVNQMAVQLTGFSEEELLNMKINDLNRLSIDKYVTVPDEIFCFYTKNNELKECFSKIFTINNSTAYILNDSSLIKEKIKRDINENNFWKEIINIIPMALVINGISGPLYANDTVMQILGITPEEWVNQTPEEFQSKFDLDEMLELQKKGIDMIEKYRNEGIRDVYELEYRIRHKDGSWRWVHAVQTIIDYFSDNGFPNVLIAAIDITDRKNAENEIKRLYDELDKHSKREKELLEEIIRKKDYELSEMTIRMAEKNQCLIKLKNQALELQAKTVDEVKDISKKIISSINKKLKDDKSWNLFEIQFNNSNPFFIKNLLNKFPDLRINEVRIVTLMKLGLDTKQISEVMNLSVRTVENHRFHIRKKLSIDKNEAIYNYLQSFS